MTMTTHVNDEHQQYSEMTLYVHTITKRISWRGTIYKPSVSTFWPKCNFIDLVEYYDEYLSAYFMSKLPKCHREGWIDCFFSTHKEANIDSMGLEYTSFLYACLLPKKGYHTLKHKVCV